MAWIGANEPAKAPACMAAQAELLEELAAQEGNRLASSDCEDAAEAWEYAANTERAAQAWARAGRALDVLRVWKQAGDRKRLARAAESWAAIWDTRATWRWSPRSGPRPIGSIEPRMPGAGQSEPLSGRAAATRPSAT